MLPVNVEERNICLSRLELLSTTDLDYNQLSAKCPNRFKVNLTNLFTTVTPKHHVSENMVIMFIFCILGAGETKLSRMNSVLNGGRYVK